MQQRWRDAGGAHRVGRVRADLVLVQVEEDGVVRAGSRPNFAMKFSRWTATALPSWSRLRGSAAPARTTSPVSSSSW